MDRKPIYKEFEYIPKLSRSGYLRVGFSDFYRFFYKKFSKKSNQRYIEDEKLAKDILESILLKLNKAIIVEGYIMKIPHKLGMIYVGENVAATGFYRDTRKSIKEGRNVYRYNTEIEGSSPRIKWYKSYTKTRMMSYYKFKPIRGEAKEYWGYRGMWQYVKDTFRDPKKRNYKGHVI